MQFAPPANPKRKPSLTPMIDVVFLLLVFFMLASRFGFETAITLPMAGGGGSYSGPPRLVDIGANPAAPNALRINGAATADVVQALTPLMQAPTDTIILRGDEDTSLQRIITVTEQLRAAGMTNVVLVE